MRDPEHQLMNPKLSICMPTYNQARYLPAAIESVLAQTFSDFEFIIIDDNSRDDCAEIIQSYAGRDRRIRPQINNQNAGMVHNWNKCLRSARGEYVKYLFGDDKFQSPAALAELIAVMDSNPDISLAASARHEIDESSRVLKKLSFYRPEALYPGGDIIKDCIVEQKNRIGEPSAVIFRKKHAVRGFDSRYRQIVDLEMWFHLLEQGMFAYIDKPLVGFRLHPGQQTRQNALNPALIDEPFLLLGQYSNKPYIRLSRFQKRFMRYVPLYGIWKLYKKHKKLSCREAWTYIREKTTGMNFIVFYPFFKIYKLYLTAVEKRRARH